MSDKFKYSDDQIKYLLDGIYGGSITDHDLPEDLYYAIADYLKSGLYTGFGGTLTDFAGKDLELLQELRENIYMFSAAKTFQETKDIRDLMFNADGDLVSNREFNQLGAQAFDTWNNDWGLTERNTAIAQATIAGQWNEIQANKDLLPNLTYSTIGDACDICAPLDGFTAPVDDPVWDSIMPVNHFNCFKIGTPILTPEGWVDIEEIQKGDLIIGGSGNVQNITGIHIKGFEGNLKKISIKNKSISSTENHGILSINGWKRVDNLTVNDILIQNFKGSFFDKTINAINNFCVVLTYLFVSIKRKWKTALINTLNSSFKVRQININKTTVYKFVANTINALRYKKIKNNLFAFSQFFVINIVPFRLSIVRFNSFIISFFANIQIKHRIILFHSLNSVGATTTQCRVTPFSCFFELIRGINFPLISINPLKGNGFRSGSEFKPVFSKKSHKSPIINIPKLTHFWNRNKSNKINVVNSFTAGAPLDRFNFLFDFQLHSFFHRKFVLVKNIVDIHYSGQIYNLSVNNDETYITNVCVVHNCLCIVTQEDEEAILTPDNEKESIFDSVTSEMSDEFKMNPGKDGYIFSPDHPYFEVAAKDIPFAKENFGLPIPSVAEETGIKEPITGLSIEEAKKVMSELTIPYDERAAIKTYTGGNYSQINAYERGIRKTISSENEGVIKELSKFIESAPKVTAESYRGLTLDEYSFSAFKNLKKGEQFMDDGFLSTSFDRSIAHTFGGSAQYQVEMTIKGKGGVLIEGLSDAKKEHEIIFNKGSKFIIKDIKIKEKTGIFGKISLSLIEL